MRSSSLSARSWLLLLALCGLLLTPGTAPLVSPAHADEEGGDDADPFGGIDDTFDGPTSFTPQQADTAIKGGVNWLRKNQQSDGSWGEITGGVPYGGNREGTPYTHPAGPTALALYALLKCKVPTGDPIVKRGFAFLKKHHEKPQGSYETSAVLLAVCATGDPFKGSSASAKARERIKMTGPMRSWAQTLVKHLLDKRSGQVWRYNVGSGDGAPGGNQDLSSTQLAALALFAAHAAGIRAPESVWEDILAYSLAQQDADGPTVLTKDPVTGKEIRRRSRGFAYIKGQPDPNEGQATGGMTACGMANVMMARFVLTDGGRTRAQWDRRPDAAKVQESVEDALTWLAKNWSNYKNPHKHAGNIYHLYWLYAVERAMELTGLKLIGNHPWYSEMGQQLIDRQDKEGWWDSQSTLDPRKVLDTCFAILFLRRATQGQIPFPDITGGTDEEPVDNR